MKRIPPRVRESAVGLPPIIQTLRIIEGPHLNSSPILESEQIDGTITSRSQGENEKNNRARIAITWIFLKFEATSGKKSSPLSSPCKKPQYTPLRSAIQAERESGRIGEDFHKYRNHSNDQNDYRNSGVTMQHGQFLIPKGLRNTLEESLTSFFDAWEHLMRANLRSYRHSFQDSQSILDHKFAQTSGKAMEHLIERMKPNHPEQFIHEKQMFDWLKSFFKDPNQRETARVESNRCPMSPNETFNSFYSRFSVLASKARIDQSVQLKDIFRKLHPDLHWQSINFMATEPDYETALKRLHFLDNELKLNQEYRNCRVEINFTAQKTRNAELPTSLSPKIKKESNLSPMKNYNHETARNSSQMVDGLNKMCYNCYKTGHLSKDCSKSSTHV
ncbi:hypothetical protein GcM1_169002 [Golovinomyces cichoracearum]|uniref:CCHC-type domain-containing protein n=1 Tax=Golovinomyces cichoracearum TaxID=62708 RepID=A0A420J738_9PEZI|nr:hypothetical protein GcM1_169002 [Golovinomyces cichoracearum]